jgi:hypothetical protein
MISPGPAPAESGRNGRTADFVAASYGALGVPMPLEQPAKFELVANLEALGIDVPPTLLARAEKVIE